MPLQTGTIPVLLNLVAGTIREYGPGGAGAPGALSSRIIDMQVGASQNFLQKMKLCNHTTPTMLSARFLEETCLFVQGKVDMSLSGLSGTLRTCCSCLQLVCTALTRIAEDDELAHSVRQCNGVTLLGKLLLLQPPAGTPPAGEGCSEQPGEIMRHCICALLPGRCHHVAHPAAAIKLVVVDW
jgi:hypothetical protein